MHITGNMDIGRRRLLQAVGGLVAAPLRAAPGKTNVLLIISDQLHHGALGIAGHPVVKTPNIDRLAREGVRFTQALCTTPFCSPTRASIMTALFPHKHGITYNVGDPKRGLNPALPSTEQVLFENGYRCGQKGKWHLGDKTTLPPYAKEPELDYREYLRKANVKRSVVLPPVVKTAVEGWAKEDARSAKSVSIGRSEVPIANTQESWTADLAIRQMQEMAGKPFFLTASFIAPHAPWVVNEPYYSMYERSRIPLPANRRSVEEVDRKNPSRRFGDFLGDEGMREYLAVYYGLVSMMDWNVGRLLDALKKMGQDRNTLVIFTSDHGDMQDGHGMFGKRNFSSYEETSRIPLIMRYPGVIPANRVVNTQAGTCDIQPTILDYLGLKPRGAIHGHSLRSYINGKEEPGRPMFNEHERGRENFQRTIRTTEWRYCYSSDGVSQLYHLAKDPGETKNLLHDSSAKAIKQKLHGELARWMRETEDPRAAKMPANA